MAYNFPKVPLASDLVFQIQLFLGKLVLQIVNLAVCLCIVQSDRDLAGYFGKQVDVVLLERFRVPPPNRQYSEFSIAVEQRDDTSQPNTLGASPVAFGIRPVEVGNVHSRLA